MAQASVPVRVGASSAPPKLDELVRRYKLGGIIFDFDGTLTDTLDEHVEAFHSVFKSHGYLVSRDVIRGQMGRRPADITRTLIFNDAPDHSLCTENCDLLYCMAGEKEATFKALIPEHPPILPGLPDILIQAKKLGLKLAVVSSTTREPVKLILERIGILDYFDAVVAAEDVINGKPHPEPFLKGLERIGVPKRNVFVIGDSIHDVGSARAGGMKVIAVATGKHSMDTLRESGPTMVIPTLEALM